MYEKRGKNKMKKFVILLLMIITLSAIPLEVRAANENYESSIDLRENKIEYKFRQHNGRTQYRRWNRTLGCWVDPDWIDC